MVRLSKTLLVVSLVAFMVGCPSAPTGLPIDSGDTTTPTDNTPAGDVSDAALSYEGVARGTISTTSSTEATSSESSGHPAGQSIGEGAFVRLTDLNGAPLLDANGEPYTDLPLNSDGTFALQGLPVGVDIVLHIFLTGGEQTEPDLKTIINIPKDEGAQTQTGSLEGVKIDPLSTLAFAALADLVGGEDVDLDDLGISLAALIAQTRATYESLFQDTGIQAAIALADLSGARPEELAALFETLVPSTARSSVEMAGNNVALASASDIAGVLRAVVPMLLRGGFVIINDLPDEFDSALLLALPGVRSVTMEQFFNQIANEFGGPNDGTGGPSGGNPQGQTPPTEMPTVFFCPKNEPDRNFLNAIEGPRQEEAIPHGPAFSLSGLQIMAEAYLAGETITLQQLHTLLTDVEIGLGARLTYFNFGGSDGRTPVDVFVSPNGTGVEKNLNDLFERLAQAGAFEDEFMGPPMGQTVSIRQILAEFLEGTEAPSLPQLLSIIPIDPIRSAEAFARRIREMRAHVPFSTTGPSEEFVVADDDPFRNEDAQAVTVDIETDRTGDVTKVTYNGNGEGSFLIGFGPETEQGMEVRLVNRRSGRMLHNYQGEPLFLEMGDDDIFQPVNSERFYDTFSETVTDYPGNPVTIPNLHFDPEQPEDPHTNPKDFEAYVLADEFGGDPVLVDRDGQGTVTHNENGTYYVAFGPDTWQTGLFELITEQGRVLETTPGDPQTRVLVAPADIQGIDLAPQTFTHVYGMSVPNPAYNPAGAPFYDDLNGNGVEDEGEPTFSERHFLFDPNDWRSTFVEKFYRRADNNGFPDPFEIDWESNTPALRDGTQLVPRNLLPRLNGYLFGRPGVSLDLLLAFSPPAFFNGTHALNEDTELNPFMVMAVVNLVMDSLHNVEAVVDFDGPAGPFPAHEELVPAYVFIAPVGDPLQLLIEGFESLAAED